MINIGNQPSIGEQYLQITYRTFPPPDIVTPPVPAWYEKGWQWLQPRKDRLQRDIVHGAGWIKTWLKKIFFLTV